GARVQGDSHRNFAEALQKRVVVGAVYKVTCYGICPLRPAFRACRFPHCIQITPSTKFELQPPTDPPFIRDSFDFIDFALLPKRLPPCPYFGLEVVVSLWSEFSNLIDPDTVRLDDALNPVITNVRPIAYVPPKFDTPEKLKKHAEESFRTIRELLDLCEVGDDSVCLCFLPLLFSIFYYMFVVLIFFVPLF
ncbi:hypothetical protein LINPERPRIM_LOCUS15445, partial [Linum perenne]